MRACILLLLLPTWLLSAPVRNAPRIAMAAPLGLAPGVKTKLLLRGSNLSTATEVRLDEPKATAHILRKGNAAIPDMQDVKQIGNTEIEVEVRLPADYPRGNITLAVVTPTGQSVPYSLPVDRGQTIAEKEPNDGFRQAERIQPGQTIIGSIARNQDVDVFRFEGVAGQRLTLEVTAARLGSALDSFLTLYGAEGQILATNDDFAGSADSYLDVTLSRSGTYYVSVIDAHDQGGPAHPYRLKIHGR